jgi:hypothetical protein
MRSKIRWAAAALVLVALLAGCEQIKEVAHKARASYTIEKVGDTGFSRVTLEAKAAERLAVATSPVRTVKTAKGLMKSVAYSAIIYGTKGETWTFTSPQRLAFVREEVTVDHIAGDVAYLSVGPANGTEVVTVGAAEIYGLEKGFGK